MNDEELRRLLRRSDGPIVIRPLHASRPRLTLGKLAAVMSLGAAAAIVSLVIGTALGNWREQGPKEGEPHAAAASIDPSAGNTGLLAEIPLEHVPTSVAVLPFENRLLVADRDGGLSAFDTATNRLVNRVVLPLSGPVPAKITAIPSTKRVYVTDFSGDRVLVIDGSTLDVIATVPTGRAPTAITSDAKANRIYVANLGLQSARVDQSVPGSVTVIDGGGSVLATVPTRGHPITLDVSPGVDSNRLYVGALGLPGASSFIQVIDTFTKSEVASVGVAAPSALVADPVDNAIYAVTPFQAAPLGSRLIELDTRTNVAATSVVDSPGDARAIGWHPGSDDRYQRIYVASQTDLGGILHIYRTLPGVIRLSEVGAVRVGAEPVALAVDGASHRVYVASAKTISVVLQGPEPTTPNTTPPFTASGQLGDVRLGSGSLDVIAVLGQPSRRTITHGLGTPQWEYDSGYVVYFAGPDSRVWQIQLSPPSTAGTVEGFRIGGSESAFRSTYALYAPRQFTASGRTQLQIAPRGQLLIAEFDATGGCDLLILRTDPGPP